MSENNEEKRVEIKLERHLWPDEKQALEEEKARKKGQVLLFAAVFCLLCASFGLGMVLGSRNSNGSSVAPSSHESSPFTRMESIYNKLLSDWWFVNDLENPEEALIDRAIRGMIGKDVDPHTEYMTAEEALAFQQGIDLGFVGIGVSYTSLEDKILILKVFYDSPAYRAGLQPGDLISEVDHQSVAGWTTEEIKNAVQGEEGTIVNITYIRQNEEFSVDITRGVVENSIYGEIRDGYGYLELYQFSTAAPTEVQKYLEYFKQNNVTKLVIDVRDDGGGYLSSLIGVADLFLDKGQVILTQEYSDGEIIQSTASGKNQYVYDKMVILGNENSASASEALIGALTQNGKAVFIGTTTYGKSTIQVPYYYSDGSTLKYTHGIWKTPNGSIINLVGITPDIAVDLHPILNMNYVTLGEEELLKYDQVDGRLSTLQYAMDFLGYPVDRFDGYFSKATEECVRSFQSDLGLNVTGEIDAETANLMCSEVTRLYNLDTYKYDLQLLKAEEYLNE